MTGLGGGLEGAGMLMTLMNIRKMILLPSGQFFKKSLLFQLASSRPDSGFGRNEPDLCEYLLGMAGQNSVILDSGILCTYRNLYFKSG